MSDITSARWYVVQTQVNGESKAAENLRRQGFETYLPRYLKRRRHARKVDFAARALFPRYMFVAIDMATQRWRSVQSTFGVSRLVTNGDEPAVVPEGVVCALRAREDAKGFVKLDASGICARRQGSRARRRVHRYWRSVQWNGGPRPRLHSAGHAWPQSSCAARYRHGSCGIELRIRRAAQAAWLVSAPLWSNPRDA